MGGSRKHNWKLWIGLLISLVLLYFAIRKVDIGNLSRAFREANYIYIIPGIVLSIFQLWMRAVRWQVLMNPIRKVPVSSLFSALMIGSMANNIFPARFGEVVRAYVIGHKEQIKKSTAFATVVVERLFDSIALLTMFALILLFHRDPLPLWLKRAAYITVGLNVIALGFLWLARSRSAWLISVIRKILKPFPERLGHKITDFFESFIHGLEILRSTPQMLYMLGFSILIWIPPALVIYCLLLSFHIVLPLYASFLLLVIFCLGIAVPAGPGFVGVIQFLSVTGLALFGVDRSEALSFSFVYQAMVFIPITAIGLVYFFREGLTFGQIKASMAEEGEISAATDP